MRLLGLCVQFLDHPFERDKQDECRNQSNQKEVQDAYQAKELGIHYFACGHHATERYGVQALGAKVQKELGIEVAFFDDHNPA